MKSKIDKLNARLGFDVDNPSDELTTMDKRIAEFKEHWNKHYSYISLELDDDEIVTFLQRFPNSITTATDMAADYLLAQGLAEVQE